MENNFYEASIIESDGTIGSTFFCKVAEYIQFSVITAEELSEAINNLNF